VSNSTKEAEVSGKVFHVLRGANGWEVRDHGAVDVSDRDFSTKEQAVESARDLARRSQPARVLVHAEGGEIETEFGYADEPLVERPA
jgi:hypothetical protein